MRWVAVHLDGEAVGTLSEEDAVTYEPVLRAAAYFDELPAVEGRIYQLPPNGPALEIRVPLAVCRGRDVSRW